MSASQQGFVTRTAKFAVEVHQQHQIQKSDRVSNSNTSSAHEWYHPTSIASDYDIEVGDICVAQTQQYQSLKRSSNGQSAESQQPRVFSSLSGYMTQNMGGNDKELEENRDENIQKSYKMVGFAGQSISYEKVVKGLADTTGFPLVTKGTLTIINRGPEHFLAGDFVVGVPPPKGKDCPYYIGSSCRKVMPVPLRMIKTTDYRALEKHLKNPEKPGSLLHQPNHTLANLMALMDGMFKLGQANAAVGSEDQRKALIANALTGTGPLKKTVANLLNFARLEWQERTDSIIAKTATGALKGQQMEVMAMF